MEVEDKLEVLASVLIPEKEHEVRLLEDGLLSFVVPAGRYGRGWARRLTGVDPSRKGGYALEGPWLSPGETEAAALGDVIAVGSKDKYGLDQKSTYTVDFQLYVVTSIRLVHMASANKVSPSLAARLLGQLPEERVEAALRKLIQTADEQLTKLVMLDRAEYADELPMITQATTSWLAIKEQAEKALAGADPQNNIVDLDSALTAIVSVGYRELAKRYHPDTGGSVEIMVLINSAKQQLAEVLALAKEAQ